MNIDKIVALNYDKLNENDKYIWQYIFHNKQACKKMSIQDLAKACNVSHTSIIRFTRKIGLDGYAELKVHLKWNEQISEEFDNHVVMKTATNLKETIDLYNGMDLDEVLKEIEESNFIFVYATGEVQYHAALELKRTFSCANKVVHVIEGKTEIDLTIQYAKRNDIFIIISLSGDNQTAVMLAKALKQMKIKTIAISLDNNNLLNNYCDHNLGFTAASYYTGLSEQKYTSGGHFYILIDLLFAAYLEYLNNK